MSGISDGISFRSVLISLLKGITFIKTHTTGGGDMQWTGMMTVKTGRLLRTHAANTCFYERLFAVRHEIANELSV